MRKLSTLEKRNERTGYLFILPWIIGFLIFFLSPIVNSLLYAFQNVSVRAGGLDRPFVGVQFFRNDVYPFRFINPEGIRNETIVPGRVFLEKTI